MKLGGKCVGQAGGVGGEEWKLDVIKILYTRLKYSKNKKYNFKVTCGHIIL